VGPAGWQAGRVRLVLVRHGRTPSNRVIALDTAVPGASLDDIGRSQAAAVAPLLARRRPDSLWVSTLVRTQETAAPLARLLGLEPRVRDGLREIDAGELEMLEEQRAFETYFATMVAWGLDDLDARHPGGVSGHEFLARFDAVVEEIAATSRSAVAFSHGAAIRTWVALRVRDPQDARFATAPRLDNTAYVEIDGDPRHGWDLVRWESESAVATE
jgi:probable phosphoglycerate mutase